MEELFEKLWKLYPNKKGKSGVSTKAKKELEKAGEETVTKAINNYIAFKNTQPWRSWLDGSTFFNSRWKDYLEPEAAPQQPAPVIRKEPAKSNYKERTYSEEFLNSFVGGGK